jgi:hypothetical protein
MFFCNFDDGSSGSCEPCSGHANVNSCRNDGLPDPGAQDCAQRCFAPQPTSAPTIAAPTIAALTASPTSIATASPTVAPTGAPTPSPTLSDPTFQPTASPTSIPTVPTYAPTAVPTYAPTAVPTYEPTYAPTAVPTYAPTAVPTYEPTYEPTAVPTYAPTAAPTDAPTPVPTPSPTISTVGKALVHGKWWLCPDGKEANLAQTDCVNCAPGTAGVAGVCSICAIDTTPNESRTGCFPVEVTPMYRQVRTSSCSERCRCVHLTPSFFLFRAGLVLGHDWCRRCSFVRHCREDLPQERDPGT